MARAAASGVPSNFAIAYEPIWAIGTGKVAVDRRHWRDARGAARADWSRLMAMLAISVRILYGGSVNASNAAEIFAVRDVDGALVGGASLDRRPISFRSSRRQPRVEGRSRRRYLPKSPPRISRKAAMFTFLLIVQTLVAAALVGVILMQRSEGGGLGVGGSSSGLMTARGAADFLTRATAVLGGDVHPPVDHARRDRRGQRANRPTVDTSLANRGRSSTASQRRPAAPQQQPARAAQNEAAPAVPLAQ